MSDLLDAPPAAAGLHGTTSAEPAATATRTRWRALLGWVLVTLLVLGGSLVGLVLAAGPPDRGVLDPEGRGPAGALALAELVREEGTEVVVARTRAEAVALLRPGSTLVTTHPHALSDDAVSALFDTAERLVVLSGDSRMLRLLDLGTPAVVSTGPQPPGCEIAAFRRVGTVQPERLFIPGPGVTGCFGTDDAPAAGAAAGVLVDDRTGRSRILVDGAALFRNDALTENGNAALGLALLAPTAHVVWYVPSYSDTDMSLEDTESLGALTPGWVTPAILLLLIAGLAAAFWRGRRFGPLVSETLPVTVRAAETMQGRARLTARAGDAAHAGAALRTGALLRLGTRLGIDGRTTPGAVADATADRLRRPRAELAALLVGPLPATDPELIVFARDLAEIENAVDATIRTERKPE